MGDCEDIWSYCLVKRMKRKSNEPLVANATLAKHQKIIQKEYFVTLQGLENEYLHFDLTKSSTFGTLISSCAEHIGVPSSWIGLLYNDRKIGDDDTPELLKMKRFDVVDLLKIGWIQIKIHDHNLGDRITPFNVKMTTTIEELKKAYLDSIGVPESLIEDLTYKSELISGDATPLSLGMVQNDIIEIGQEATMNIFLISDFPTLPDISLNIRRSATMLQVKQQYVQKTRRMCMNPSILILEYREEEVGNEDTPGSLWMTNNETVFVYLSYTVEAEAA